MEQKYTITQKGLRTLKAAEKSLEKHSPADTPRDRELWGVLWYLRECGPLSFDELWSEYEFEWFEYDPKPMKPSNLRAAIKSCTKKGEIEGT